jgi:hypothetical protein
MCDDVVFGPGGEARYGPAVSAVVDPRPVGIVSTDIDLVADYVETTRSPYVVIRTLADVPPRLGGLALLGTEQAPLELLEAVAQALLNGEED